VRWVFEAKFEEATEAGMAHSMVAGESGGFGRRNVIGAASQARNEARLGNEGRREVEGM